MVRRRDAARAQVTERGRDTREPQRFQRRLEIVTSAARAFKTELDALEARMGELASLLSEMADALTSYPESIRIIDASETGVAATTAISLRAQEWPSIQEIEQLLSNWRRLRDLSDSGVPG